MDPTSLTIIGFFIIFVSIIYWASTVKDEVGQQVDGWGAIVMERAKTAERIRAVTIETMSKRGLKELVITPEGVIAVKESMHDWYPPKYRVVMFKQSLDRGVTAVVALRVMEKGEDLELWWRLFVQNSWGAFGAGANKGVGVVVVFFGIAFIGAGLLTSIFGYGLCLLPIGGVIITAGMRMIGVGMGGATVPDWARLEAAALARAVDYSLMKSLANCGIAAHELKITQPAQMDGMGHIAGQGQA